MGAFPLAAGSADAALLANLEAGSYSASVTSSNGATGVALVEVYDAGPAGTSLGTRLVNISTRGRVGAGDDLLIAGIVVSGNAPKRLLVRAIGPTLGDFGVGGALLDPVLTVLDGQTIVASNDDWASSGPGTATPAMIAAAATKVGAFALPVASKDSCMLLSLPPGSYTATVAGKSGSTGVALVEVYEIPD